MKIAIDLRPLMAGKVSGVEVYIKSMLEAIFELKTKHSFVLWYNAFKKIDTSHFPKIPENVQLVRTRIPNKLFNLSLSLLRWPKLDKLIGRGACLQGGRIDVLWVPDPRPAPVSKKCKKIITFHDLSFEDFRYSFNLKTRLWHRILRPGKEAAEADAIIAVSQFTKSRLLEEYKIGENKIQVIYEAAGERLKPLDLPKSFELIKRKYGLPDNYFLCLSTLEPRKNTAGIIEAYLAWQEDTKVDVDLVIAGKKHPEIFSETKLKKHPDIHLTGFIDEEDKALLYQHALAFLYPSFYEGFGLPILEAMQCGTPVITSDATAMPEVAGDAAVLVNPGELKELKNAMHEIYRDNQLRSKLIEKGFAHAKKFTWKKAVEELIKSLENVKKNSN
ncbi:MAG: glycosyltransferase family 1 protein [Patescibacteria group bacterium]